MKIPLIVVAGPTASGKTSLAVHLAERFGGEVVSADSMQIYKKLNIGTAKPTEEEQGRVPHHMIDILDINENFSVVDYCEMAHKIINDIYKRGHLPIVAGGTGLYIDSLVNDEDFSSVSENKELREELTLLAEKEGNERVYKILSELDSKAAENLHPNNLKRVIRAIEIIKETGKSLSESIKREKAESRYDVLYLVLSHDRGVLYERINQRVDKMIEEGLVDEAKWLFDTIENENATCLQAIGYKEFKEYFEGNISLEEAKEELKKDTRHYAKRQMTWFRRNENAKIVDCKDNPFEEALRISKEFILERRSQ